MSGVEWEDLPPLPLYCPACRHPIQACDGGQGVDVGTTHGVGVTSVQCTGCGAMLAQLHRTGVWHMT